MEKVVIFLSKACVSVPGLIFFNILIFTINFKFLYWLIFSFKDHEKINLEDFHNLSSPLAVRLITVGVLILERHDVLEISGLVKKGSEHDEISERSHPFGTFYLCFGLLMECLIEQIHLPGKLFDPQSVTNFVIWSSFSVAVISFLASLQLFYILFRHARPSTKSS